MSKLGSQWTEEEISFLIENTGKLSLEQIARKLGRSYCSTVAKADKHGVANGKMLSTLYTSNQLSKVLGVACSTISRWTIDMGLKYRWKRYRTTFRFKMIGIEDFYQWGESHQDIIDTRKIRADNLGNEPDWLKEKRKRDAAQPGKHTQLWTKAEEQQLIAMYDAGVCKEDVALRLGRTESGVQRKADRLKASGYLAIDIKGDFYTDMQTKALLEYRAQGMTYREIGQITGRSKGSICKKIEQLRKVGVLV